MNVLLVGLGRWGEKHLRVLHELGVTVWVAETSPARRQWAVARGVAPERTVADYRAALDRVEAVDVVTPAHSHRDLACASLAAGRPCFVEKPLTATVAEARDVVVAAAAAGRVVQVGHIFRFHPVTAALKGALAAGRVGAVRYATGRFAGFKRPRTDVGVTQTDAIHYFDLFAHLLGPATGVTAVLRDHLGRGLDDMSVAVVEYGRVPVVVEADYFVPGTHRECVVIGERGSLVADYGAGTVTLHAGEHRRREAGWEAVDEGKEELPVGREEPLRLELEAFLAACAGGGAPLVTAEAGLHALEIVEAAVRSARHGRRVALA
ncbi:MAG TPA: Gfo/Idh/MocA family oxidoreductase [Methylomirabilota bacterium]|nr:Gfo/Idh/MocA family oxidoreductase [Methylomirabilota bacterium]